MSWKGLTPFSGVETTNSMTQTALHFYLPYGWWIATQPVLSGIIIRSVEKSHASYVTTHVQNVATNAFQFEYLLSLVPFQFKMVREIFPHHPYQDYNCYYYAIFILYIRFHMTNELKGAYSAHFIWRVCHIDNRIWNC